MDMLELIWMSAAVPVGITVAALALAWLEAELLAPTPASKPDPLGAVATDLRVLSGTVPDPRPAP
jgi:hypothetical protein